MFSGLGVGAAAVHPCVSAGDHGVFSPQIPSLPTGLFVSAKGEGCCLMQVRLQGEWAHSGIWTPGPQEGWVGGGSELSIQGGYVCLRDPKTDCQQPSLTKAEPSECDLVSPWVWGSSRKIHFTGFHMVLPLSLGPEV